MRIEVTKTPQGIAINAGEICPVDTKKKHWMAKIIGLDEKFGFNRDFLKRAIYDKKGKAAGYSIEGLKEGDIVEEADAVKNREYALVKKIGDGFIELEYMRAANVTEHFKSPENRSQATLLRY
ncbi:MAG TPA: hypothetical protein VMC84_13335 [Methanocella sp.]|uniref:hypothetical protein n=1 Tax=Methanocella sp. TaxID=2052833 RepID=UPI002CE0B4D7|nr:hypothetical protein [Methanocella sp.]HTY92153.1 hypothetical protein [Methanocella sp.]